MGRWVPLKKAHAKRGLVTGATFAGFPSPTITFLYFIRILSTNIRSWEAIKKISSTLETCALTLALHFLSYCIARSLLHSKYSRYYFCAFSAITHDWFHLFFLFQLISGQEKRVAEEANAFSAWCI